MNFCDKDKGTRKVGGAGKRKRKGERACNHFIYDPLAHTCCTFEIIRFRLSNCWNVNDKGTFDLCRLLAVIRKQLTCENIRFSSLFVDGDVSRETSSSTKSEEKRIFSQAILGPLSLPRLLRSRPQQSHGLLVWRRARRTEVFRRVTVSARQRGLPCRHSRRKGGEKYLVSCPSPRTLPKAEGWNRV